MKGKGAQLLFDRVTLYVVIESDEGFRQNCAEGGTDVYECLDNELADTSATYLLLKTVLEHYPDRKVWDKTLQHLIAEIKQAQNGDKKTHGEGMKWKPRALSAEKRVVQLEKEIDILNARISELERFVQLLTKNELQTA